MAPTFTTRAEEKEWRDSEEMIRRHEKRRAIQADKDALKELKRKYGGKTVVHALRNRALGKVGKRRPQGGRQKRG